ncbi:EAL domain-containing protein [Aeromonas jandaei]|uniref:EAL domain-containing protein n=1 Tax=Aeromonas jandaei TaxID=650 RepID=UPI003BA1D45D
MMTTSHIITDDDVAFDSCSVIPFFQKIVSVAADKKEKCEGIEILARIKKGDQYLSPANFSCQSYTPNTLNKLTSVLLCKTLSHIEKTLNKPNFISFNVYARQLQMNTIRCLIDTLSSLYSEFESRGIQLVMEITENEKLETIDGVMDTLRLINKIGIKIAIDDYGKYFSSPSMVSFVEDVHILKIDKSIIDSLEVNCLISRSFIKHAFDIAKIKNCHILIEGIERESQLELLGNNVNHSTIWYQGYFFSRPRPIHDLK